MRLLLLFARTHSAFLIRNASLSTAQTNILITDLLRLNYEAPLLPYYGRYGVSEVTDLSRTTTFFAEMTAVAPWVIKTPRDDSP